MNGVGAQAPALSSVRVAVELPRHGSLGAILDYLSDHQLSPGTLVRVPLGKRTVPGIVWDAAEPVEPDEGAEPEVAFERRAVTSAAAVLPPLSTAWRRLITFAAAYYQRSVGELALSTLPPQLRQLDDAQFTRVLKKHLPATPAGDEGVQPRRKPARKRAAAVVTSTPAIGSDATSGDEAAAARRAPVESPPELTAEQQAALATMAAHAAGTTLLEGVTGSGKTEVYLRAAERALAQGRQVLVLVPEINLTPQLEARFAVRFAAHRMATLHSALTPAQRLAHWLAAHLGTARLVLGTRLAVFASMPDLGLVIVDEEHDPSFKQQEGARYSARDLAVWRGQHERIPVLLGSATPSLESWKRAREGHYRHVVMRERIGAATLPAVHVVDMQRVPREALEAVPLAPPVLDAMRERLARGEQSMVLLNRRGYAPVLHCTSCGWKSACPHCSAWRVFHKADRTLRCHHCGLASRVPRACPECGDLDIAAIGRGTQKLEEQLAAVLPQARIARIDADTVRHKGALEAQLGAVHAGEVDVLVGTQMVAKGHDFRRMTLVVAVDPDGALFSSDFRAGERLFALLMQAAGRAGRDAAQSHASQMWVQTANPAHALFAALKAHDFERFANAQLDERRRAHLPPYASLALLRADARSANDAEDFLRAAGDAAHALAESDGVTVYPPVPLHVARVADVERMQMLVESPSRVALQRMLNAWQPALRACKAQHKGVLRFAVDVDPLAI